MENNEIKCFCKLFFDIPILLYPCNAVIEYVIRKNFKYDKDGNLICKKCGRTITDDEIKESSKKILPIVW